MTMRSSSSFTSSSVLTFIITLIVIHDVLINKQHCVRSCHSPDFFFLKQVTKVIVYIEETNSMADVTFPSLPHVVSLLHYDDVTRTPDNLHPPAGYPVICVTVSQAEMN